MNVFPPCAQNSTEFTINYILYGPFCLIATACSFIYIILNDWNKVEDHDRRVAILLLITIIATSWIFLPISIILEAIKCVFTHLD